MKLVYENKKLIGSFIKGRFVEIPPINDNMKNSPNEMAHIFHMVLNHNPDRIEEFDRHLRQFNLRKNKLQDIIAESAMKAMLRFKPEMPGFQRYKFDIPEETPNLSPEGSNLKYSTFELDLNILGQMVYVAIRKVTEEEYLPYPKAMIIGKCLHNAVKHGKLPKRFKTRIMDMDLIYDSGIDGIAFI